MNKKILIGVGVLIVIILVVLIWERTVYGNISIRRVENIGVKVTLDVSEPVVPGVTTSVRWRRPSGGITGDVIFEVRSTKDTFFVGQARLTDGAASILIPCALDEPEVGISMLDAETNQVLGAKLVQALPAGPDCL